MSKVKARVRVTDDGAALVIDGVIGDELGGVTAETVRESLEAMSGDRITVHINSPGGAVFEGLSIYNALREHPATIEVVVDGLAASIASVIAMAGDRIVMPEASMLMVHNPWTIAIGDAERLRQDAGMLDKVRDTIVTAYQNRTGMGRDKIIGLMNAETWFTAAEAVNAGFADELKDADANRALARLDLSLFNFTNLPAGLNAVAITTGGTDMKKETVDEIRRTVRAAKLDDTFADELIREGVTIDQARERVIDKWVEQEGPDTRSGHRAGFGSYDDPNFRGNAMAEALYCRLTGQAPSEAARPWYHHRVVDMARECLEFRGEPSRMLSDTRIIENATITTSDFPELLTGTGERILRDAYERAPAGVRRVARQTTARDFRTRTVLKFGEAPDLREVKEGGEIEHGATAEEKEAYELKTYARIFGLTRKALVNDDLNAFADMAARLGQAAAEFEAKQLVDLLTSNPTMDDGTVLFHADHNNLASSGTDVALAALSEARRAMRRQKGVDNRHIINAEPRFIVVPANQETDAEKLVSDIQSATIDDVNPFSGRLTVVTDPRLDDDSTTAWYVFADPALVPVLEYAYLQDEEGPQVFMKEGWSIDGIEWKVRLDFGAGAIDYRGAYKDPGA